MRKIMGSVLFCLVLALSVRCTDLLADRQRLNSELIRLHVVAESDSAQDQAVKLYVRDRVLQSLRDAMRDIQDVNGAKDYLQENLPKIAEIANKALRESGFDGNAVVTFCKESFDTRIYDTFTLPAGVYDSLRIVIGEGEGKNWWCVVFPEFCIPAEGRNFEDVAAVAGFSDALTGALKGEESYEIRFFLLDLLGRLENKWFQE